MLIYSYAIFVLICANISFLLRLSWLSRLPFLNKANINIARIALWLLLYICVLYLGTLLERHNYGSIYNKPWDFYAITFFGYVILSYPAMVWRYLYHSNQSLSKNN